MNTMTGFATSKYAGRLPIEPSDEFVSPADPKKDHRQPSGKRALPVLTDFLIALCVFLAAIFAWWSYGNLATQKTADLYRQLGWLPLQKVPNATAVTASVAAHPARQQPDADRIVSGQEQMTRETDQTGTSITQAASAHTGGVVVESRADGASPQPTLRLNRKPTEARSPQTLSEKGKQLSVTSGYESSCFSSASAVLQNHLGGWPTWTWRAPGHEGTMCWYAAARPRGSDRRPRGSHHRSEMMPSEEIVGTMENRLSSPFVLRGQAEGWDGGLP
jgi:hypothetical protein